MPTWLPEKKGESASEGVFEMLSLHSNTMGVLTRGLLMLVAVLDIGNIHATSQAQNFSKITNQLQIK